MAKLADPEKENNPSVDDEYSREIIESNIKQLEKEVEMHKKNLESNAAGKKRFAAQWERDQKIYSLMINNPKKLEPIYEYELYDEYWDLRQEQLIEKFNEDATRTESRLEKFDMDDKAIKEQIKSCENKLAEYKKGD